MTEIFSHTSDAPYNRHNYEVFLKNGKKQFFDNWEDTRQYWFSHSQIPDYLDFIITKDKTKGFSK